jgi:hypothetical protein
VHRHFVGEVRRAGSIRRSLALGICTSILIVMGAVTTSGAAAALSAPADQTSTPVVVKGFEFSSNAIVCPTPTICLAGGSKRSESDSGAIVVVNGADGALERVVTDKGDGTFGPFYGLGCATATSCLAVVPGDVTAIDGTNGGVKSNHAVSGLEESAACPTSSSCLVGGALVAAGPSFTATLAEATPSGSVGTEAQIGNGILNSIACVSATRCYAAISSSTTDEIDVISNGSVARSVPIATAPIAISCFEAARCVVVSNQDGITFASTLNPNNGTLGAAQPITGMANVYSVACASASQCVAVGSTSTPLKSKTADIVNGKVHAAASAPGITLSGVACSTATTCWAIGQNSKGVGIIVRAPL